MSFFRFFRKILTIAIAPAILFIALAGFRFLAEAARLPNPVPRLFSVGVAVILSSIYVGLIAQRRGFGVAWGIIPTMLVISLLAQVAIVSVEGVLASLLGTANYFNGATPGVDWHHILIHLTFIAFGEGLLLSIPAVVIYFVVQRNAQTKNASIDPTWTEEAFISKTLKLFMAVAEVQQRHCRCFPFHRFQSGYHCSWLGAVNPTDCLTTKSSITLNA